MSSDGETRRDTTPGNAQGTARGAAPKGDGPSAAQSEGSIFDRLKSPTTNGGQSQQAGMPAAGTEGPVLASDEFQQTEGGLHEGESGPAPMGGTALQTRSGSGLVDIEAPRPEDVDRRRERRAEQTVSLCFLVSFLATVAFVVVFLQGDPGYQYYNIALGMAMAVAIGGIGVGAILWAKRLMPAEHAVQEREEFYSPAADRDGAEATFKKGLAETGITRRPLLRRTLLGATAGLGALAAVPLLSLGPRTGKERRTTQWATGTRLVTVDGTPTRIGDLRIGAILTVFPEGHTDIEARARDAVILIRMRPGEETPRPGREDWSLEGHVAYSKICTHAGCPVSLYEQQTHHLLCPCHQSVFDVLDGCRAIFGPAARSLPQLPLGRDTEGYLVAMSDFDEPTGPGFWGRS